MTRENYMKFGFPRPSVQSDWRTAKPMGAQLSLAVFSAGGLSGQTETPRPRKRKILPGPLQRRSVGPGLGQAWAGKSCIRGRCE